MNYRCHSSKEKWTWTERQTDQQIDNIRNTGQWLVEGIQKKIPLKVMIIHVRTATYISLNFGWTNKSWIHVQGMYSLSDIAVEVINEL